MAKRRANHEGSIRQRKDGTWEAIISIGHDPVTGKLKRVSFYGKSQKEVGEKAAKQLRKEHATLTIEQVRSQLLPAIQGDRLYAAVLTFFMTGLRKGELLGLRWQDVHLEAGTLQVRQSLARVGTHTKGADRKTKVITQPPKTKQSERTVAVPAECITVLRRHKARQAEEKLFLGQAYQDQGFVFCREDGLPIDPRTMGRYFTRALKRAGLPHIRLHDSRHTNATWLLEQGVPMKVVQIQLGHSSYKVTADIYSHVTPELAQQAAVALNTAFTSRS